MKRTALTDGSGAWFDAEKSIMFKEGCNHDGQNFISEVTGSQWEHQALYYTKGGRWVLNEWSQWQGSTETYRGIGEPEAVRWLIVCGRTNELDSLPESVRAKVNDEISACEM